MPHITQLVQNVHIIRYYSLGHNGSYDGYIRHENVHLNSFDVWPLII